MRRRPTTNDRQNRSINVLLVEDNPGDVLLIKKAMMDVKIDIVFHVLQDGKEVVPFLKKGGKDGSVLRPNLIILDWRLTGMSGSDVLREVKEDPQLKAIPVIVMTGSSSPGDVLRAYELGAVAFILKPASYDELRRAMRKLTDFYFGVAKLPSA